MKILCTRRDLHALKSVCSRLAKSKREQPIVQFANGPAGLVAWCLTTAGHVVYCPGGGMAEETSLDVVAIPLAVLRDAAAKRSDLVEIEASTLGEVTIRWTDRGVPQVRHIERCESVPMPAAPDVWSNADHRLLDAARFASGAAAPEALRYRLDCLQLDHAGRVVGTDGKQLFIESGFEFPWADDPLVPASRIWDAPEFRTTRGIRLGRTENTVEFALNGWRVGLPIPTEGRFPKVDQIIPPQYPAMRFDLDESDAAFLRDRLDCLASDAIAVEATPDGVRVWPIALADHPIPANVVLSLGRSRSTVDRLRFVSDRGTLRRAMDVGCQQFFVFHDKRPLTATVGPRILVWMPLPMDLTEPPVDALIIESIHSARSKSTRSGTALVA